MFDFNILSIIAGIPGLLIAMVIHEYAHAQVADWMVDEAAFLHAVEDAGNGGVFDAQDVGDFLRRQCFMFPETG